MKTLILNGSPRLNGDTAALLAVLRENLNGEITEISAYRDNIKPCIDCRKCRTLPGCAIRDDMDIVTSNDFDNVIVASPVYYGLLAGPLISLASRFQFYYSAKAFLNAPIEVTPKLGAVILTAGGSKGNANNAVPLARVILRIRGAALPDEKIIMSAQTDSFPAKNDTAAAEKIRSLAARWNQIDRS
ncbi:MAG: flavodoxin family protein [Oscillospiraceae bacterium]|jgi:multimeric flavodoxin WrbA|nr:flavodoxin family protein [Oscillospiraceae bacterium]